MRIEWKNAWILMRIPFSVFLMPIFWLSVAVLPLNEWNWTELVSVFIILHFFLYPASNGYNSMVDKDEDSVGGIRNPPQVTVHLGVLVAVFDLISITSAFLVNVYFGFCVAVYWLVSKAYSSPQIRLKKMPVVSWLVVAVFQGGWSVIMVWCGLMGNDAILDKLFEWIWPVVATLFLAGTYPLTQVYQHESDARRGDVTLSALLGIKNTFVVASIFLLLGSATLVTALVLKNEIEIVFVLAGCTLPTLIYFFLWAKKVWIDVNQADYENTMMFNKLSSISLSIGFIAWLGIKILGISLLLHF